MGINEKITYLQETKELIRDAIEEKGVEVADTDSFRSYADKIKSIPQEGGDPFYEELYNARTNNGTNMTGLFARMNGDSLDLTRLDTSQCTNMSYMFEENKVKKIDCSGWDTSNVTNVSSMFSNSDPSNLIGFNSLKFPKLKSLSNMFENSKSDEIDLSTWNIENIPNVTNMSDLFRDADYKKIDLSNWVTTNVTNMSTIFNFAYNSTVESLIIPDWDMGKVTSSSNIFGYSSGSYIKNLKYIDMSRSNDDTIQKIATNLVKRTEDSYGEILIPETTSQSVIDALTAKYWKPLGPISIPESFGIALYLDNAVIGQRNKLMLVNIEPWYCTPDIELVFISGEDIVFVDNDFTITALSEGTIEFYARDKNNPDITSNTVTMTATAEDLHPNTVKFFGVNNSDTKDFIMINGKKIYLKDMDYDENTKIFTYTHAEDITRIKFSNELYDSKNGDICTGIVKFNLTEKVKNVSFNNAQNITTENLNEIGLPGWDVSNFTSFGSMFQYCNSIESLDLSNWNISGKYIHSMFSNCKNLRHVKLPNNYVCPEGSNINDIFNYCSSLKSLDLSGWDIRNSRYLQNVFSDCTSLEYLDLTGWDTRHNPYVSSLFSRVPETCVIKVSSDIWTLSEAKCDFKGTFIRV